MLVVDIQVRDYILLLAIHRLFYQLIIMYLLVIQSGFGVFLLQKAKELLLKPLALLVNSL